MRPACTAAHACSLRESPAARVRVDPPSRTYAVCYTSGGRPAVPDGLLPLGLPRRQGSGDTVRGVRLQEADPQHSARTSLACVPTD